MVTGILALSAALGAGSSIKSGIDQKHAAKRKRLDDAEVLRKQELSQGQALLSQQESGSNLASSNTDKVNRLTSLAQGAKGVGSGEGGKKLGKDIKLGT